MPNFIGSMKSDGTLTGYLSNATLKGDPVELRMNGTMLQWKYVTEDTWKNLIDLSVNNYEILNNLPTINGVEFKGEMTSRILTPSDELSNAEIAQILAQ